MSERDEHTDLNPYSRMRDFVTERTKEMEVIDGEAFQKFGNVNVRIAELELQRSQNRAVDFLVGDGMTTPMRLIRFYPIEIGPVIDLLGRIAQGIDRTYFKTTDHQTISQEIVWFSRNLQ